MKAVQVAVLVVLMHIAFSQTLALSPSLSYCGCDPIYPTPTTTTTKTGYLTTEPIKTTCVCTVSDSCFEYLEPVEGKDQAPCLSPDELSKTPEFLYEVEKVKRQYANLQPNLDILVES